MANRCIEIKTNGQQCRAWAVSNSRYCFWHDPSRGAERAEARQRGGRARTTSNDAFPQRVMTINDVRRLLDGTLVNILELDNTVRRGRLLVSLAREYRETISAGELEDRIRQMERQVGLRKNIGEYETLGSN